MKIHEYAAAGDIAGVAREVRRGASINGYNDEGLTPLMVAAASPQASAETLKSLIELGANVNELERHKESMQIDGANCGVPGIDEFLANRKPPSIHSVLSYAVQNASQQKVDYLLTAGADVKYVNECGYSALLYAVYRGALEPKDECHQLVLRLVRAGAPLDASSAYGESALSVAAHRGDFQLVKLLLDCGANPAPLRWNDLFLAVAFEDVSKVNALVTHDVLNCRDRWERTPFLLAVHAGRVDVASCLLSQGSDLTAKGRCGKTAIMHAIDRDDSRMLNWLIAQGASIDETDEFGHCPLTLAAEQAAGNCVRALLAAGANPASASAYGKSSIAEAATPEIVYMLAEQGECLSDVESEMRQQLVGHADGPHIKLSDPKFLPFVNREFGRRNPERMNNIFWDAMVRTRSIAYTAAKELGQAEKLRDAYWCFQRFGQSFTKLPDGRIIEIGGEHEDFYDPDFCIYNDVVVHHGDGTFDIFGYPEHVFPPTDFHTATLIGAYIYIIGCLGYAGRRVHGSTPVYRLNVDSLAIEPVECDGEFPGWIFKHRAKQISANEIEICGGENEEANKLLANSKTFRLNISRRHWTRV